MDFDINLILVPVTLVFLLVWLVDKFMLKQHGAAKAIDDRAKFVQNQLALSKKTLQDVLNQQGIVTDADDFMPNENASQDVIKAHQSYQIAKRDALLIKADQEVVGENALVRWAYEFLPILLAIVVVRSFIIEPFSIPSSSMVPSLHTGDFIIVNKASYGLRLPLIHTKILDTGTPKHGDVAVFRYPAQPNIYYIKRVIGLPNDTVSYKNGVLSINGEVVATEKTTHQMNEQFIAKLLPARINNHTFTDEERIRFGHEEEQYAHYYQEKLGNHQYLVRYLGDINASLGGTFLQQNSPELIASEGREWTIRVPEGQYFVMGDNRDSSQDSRYWGFVPEANLSGKATYIWMHKDAGLKLPSFDRMGAID
ncbi:MULTISPECIES: signal peptidase I [unclassified Moraxella]|uniref:signal peptidase I n=1 Tax=unclassified Moraxella TaxID=2685852 RepID=UPI002B408F07|nr:MULTISPECIES: signal peptidase I [unclassified Moraxella]